MKYAFVVLAAVISLTGCNVTSPPAYQADRAPEDRDTYNGMEGMAQYQKDQSYLLNKELSDKCAEAKVDLSVAQSNKNEDEIKVQENIIRRTCA